MRCHACTRTARHSHSGKESSILLGQKPQNEFANKYQFSHLGYRSLHIPRPLCVRRISSERILTEVLLHIFINRTQNASKETDNILLFLENVYLWDVRKKVYYKVSLSFHLALAFASFHSSKDPRGIIIPQIIVTHRPQ